MKAKYYIAKKKALETAIKDLFQFLAYPRITFRRGRPEKLSHLLVLFLIVFVCEIIIAGVLFSMIGVEEENHKLTRLMDEMSYWHIFILAVIIAPVTEEMIFRYYLTKPLVFISLVFALLIGGFSYMCVSGLLVLYAAVPLLVLVISLAFYTLRSEPVRKELVRSFVRYFPYIVYFSAAIFGFVHIFNFDDAMPWYYTPILVFPQFVIGLFLAYVRVRNGIASSMLIHAVNNMIPMLIVFFIPDSI